MYPVSYNQARGHKLPPHPFLVAITPVPHLLRSSAQPPASRVRAAPSHHRAPPRSTRRLSGPARQSRDNPALHAHWDWLSWPRRWDLAYSPAPQRGCSFQTSTVISSHGLSCSRWEPPHKRLGHYCWPLSRRVKVGPATRGATRRLTGLELENASCRGHRRGAGREPPWRGQPQDNLLRPER